MILLLSRQDDGSTREVAEWLHAIQKKFIRLNADDKEILFIGCDLEDEKFSFRINGRLYKFSTRDIKSVWHRRRGFSKENSHFRPDVLGKLFYESSSFAEKHLSEEAAEVYNYLYYLIENNTDIISIGSQFCNSVNKLIVMKMAAGCGLKVPESFIISGKKDLKDLMKIEKHLVTKAIGNGVYRFTQEFGYYSYTERIDDAFVDQLPETFFPSMVQKQVDKIYELRVFYLEGKFYAMAIFSQESAATGVDNRKNFEAEFPPRRVPYLLPQKVKGQLKQLMKKLK